MFAPSDLRIGAQALASSFYKCRYDKLSEGGLKEKGGTRRGTAFFIDIEGET